MKIITENIRVEEGRREKKAACNGTPGEISPRDVIDHDICGVEQAEQNYLLDQLFQESSWPDHLFPNSKRIKTDSMFTYLSKMNPQHKLSLNQATSQKDTITIKNLRYNSPFIFTFAKPIYIRDNTVCLIVFGARCGGDCGHIETSFYKKVYNEWIKWITVTAKDF